MGPAFRSAAVLAAGTVLLAGCSGGTAPRHTTVAAPLPGTVRTLSPGMSIAAAVAAAPAGTTFRLAAGTYPDQSVAPKDGDRFIGAGETTTTVTGGKTLTGWVKDSTGWHVSGQTQHGQAISGGATPAVVGLPEDLFRDGTPLRRVAGAAQRTSGTWWFDYSAGQIHLASAPGKHTYVTSVQPFVFASAASNVTISDLTVTDVAAPAQHAAIDSRAGSSWTITRVTSRHSHGAGFALGAGTKLTSFIAEDNGQEGITAGVYQPPGSKGTTRGITISHGTIRDNGYAGFDPGWEAGGAKFVFTTGLVASNVLVQRNKGPGLWADADNANTSFIGNTVEDNDQAGIFEEISKGAVIRGNTVLRNGFKMNYWLYGGGIVISTSSDADVYDNTVLDNYNGITALMQNRGTGQFGVRTLTDVHVHDNTIRTKPTPGPGGSGVSGLAEDVGNSSYWTSKGNTFSDNTYTLVGPGTKGFFWNNAYLDFGQMQRAKVDLGGKKSTVPQSK